MLQNAMMLGGIDNALNGGYNLVSIHSVKEVSIRCTLKRHQQLYSLLCVQLFIIQLNYLSFH